MFITIISFLSTFVNTSLVKDTLTIRLADAKKTRHCGSSLAGTLYDLPVDVVLSGPVGAGKTTFVQGFAEALGISEAVLSPTYALEQRYTTAQGTPFLHLDLYRIAPDRVAETLAHSDTHEGIRCIEWADRMEKSDHAGHGTIAIALEETGNERTCNITFDDVAFPTRADIEQWREEVLLPVHIINHCDAVAAFAQKCANVLIKEGMIIRPLLLQRAGELHDLFRFVDFREGAAPEGLSYKPGSAPVWKSWKERYPGMKHEELCATYLREKQFDALASVIEVHGLQLPSPERVTIEQQLLFYADKRVNVDRVVSLQERFDDFQQRYSDGVLTAQSKIWHAEARSIEKSLFQDNPPL
jgi:tRNA threonylcarbamoyladenosine biosynthesis protein TsaE